MDKKVVVQLGDFTFGAYEVPTAIPFGGRQRTVVHELVGGTRIVDAIGRSDADLSWSGLFLGAGALDRARYLDGLRIAGGVLELTWSEFNYTVIIASFSCSFQRTYKLPYSITCQVVADNSQPVQTLPSLSFDAAIMGDLNDAMALSSSIGDSTLAGFMSSVQTAIKAVSSFATATQTALNSVLQPIQQARQQVAILTAAIGNTILNVSTAGGTFGTPAGLQNQVSKMSQAANLTQLDARLQRMQVNTGLVSSVPNAQLITVAGGNLFALAAQYYGDASKWDVIAKANKLTDPQIVGTKTLTIPPKSTAVNAPLMFKAS